MPSPPRRPDRLFAALVVCAYLPVALFAIAHHEMWRDELHCWLVARDSPMPWDVVHNRAYDGQPPLWYLLLWLLQKVTHDPARCRRCTSRIALGVVWVFASRAPFPRPLRALFPFGYFLAYEYVALSRCYGLALLLALLLCDSHPRRFERPGRTALLLAAPRADDDRVDRRRRRLHGVLALDARRPRATPRSRGAARARSPSRPE